MDKTLLNGYMGLLVIIILWVAVWAICDSLGKIYLKSHTHRLQFYTVVAILASIVLFVFFPKEMMCL